MAVIVVGNGIIRDKGSFIDNYDIVIRINHLDKPYSVQDRGEKIDIWSFIGKKKNIAEGNRKYPTIKDIWVFSGPFVNQSKEFLQFQRSKLGCEPTTGFFTVARAVQDNPCVDIIGFDFFKGDKIHYWDDEMTKKDAIKGHNPDFEYTIIKKWEEAGKVRVFNGYF